MKNPRGFSVERVELLNENFDEVMKNVGWFGTFATRLYAVMYLAIMFGAMNIAGAVFLAASVPYHCVIDPSIVKHVNENCYLNWTEKEEKFTVPVIKNSTSQCEMYTADSLLNTSCSYWQTGEQSITNLTVKKCLSWKYDQSIFESTIITDFDLVCDNKWKQNVSQLLLMIGILFGAMFCGIGSDRWGRRVCFLVSLVILLIFSLLTSLVKVFWLFIFVRMMVGVGSIGMCISGVVYAMEITSVRDRVWVSQTLQASFSFAFMLFALFGYLERRWVFLNLIISIPLVALLPLYIWFSAESPRWLLSRNEQAKAFQTLKRMASVNGKHIEDICELIRKDRTPILKEQESDVCEVKVVVPKKNYTTIELFRNPTLRNISLVLFYNWFSVTCIYYGLTLNTTSLNGNKFLNFFLASLVEIPANFGAIFVIQLWGRRPVICLCNIVCGISLLCMMVVPENHSYLNIILFLIGKFGATATFSCIYLYSSELYPTPLRGNGLGVCSGFARLGGVASQLVIMLSHINENLPFVVFGSIAALAGVLIVLLPETRGLSLPETISDTEHIHKQREVSLMKQFVPTTLRECF